MGTWHIQYQPSLHPPIDLKEARGAMRRYSHKSAGIVGDLVGLMEIALRVDGDYDRFLALLYDADPETVIATRRNLSVALCVSDKTEQKKELA